MRKHDMPTFPDPTPTANAQNNPSSGPTARLVLGNEEFVLPQSLHPGSLQFQSALHACSALAGLPHPSHKPLTARQKEAWVAFAACMRSSGYPTFPDPTFGPGPRIGSQRPPASRGQHEVVMDIDGATFEMTNIDTGSPQFQAASGACQQKTGAGPDGGAP